MKLLFMKTFYVCTGTCHGKATEEEHKKGAVKCSAGQCNKKGMPLVKRFLCSCCKKYQKTKEHGCC